MSGGTVWVSLRVWEFGSLRVWEFGSLGVGRVGGMKVVCSQCDRGIAADDVNVSADVAFCRACESLSRLSDLLIDAESGVGRIDADGPPPRGCDYVDDGFRRR